jgi:hypothetical protein
MLINLPVHISTLKKQDWDKLFCLIDEIEKTEMSGRFKMMDDQTEEGMLPIIAFLVLAKAVNACRKTKPVLISSKNIIFQFK